MFKYFLIEDNRRKRVRKTTNHPKCEMWERVRYVIPLDITETHIIS